MNKMRVIAAYGEYEVGLTIHGCIYLKDGEGYDFNVDSAFDALHLIEDKQARVEMAKQIPPIDFTPGMEEFDRGEVAVKERQQAPIMHDDYSENSNADSPEVLL